MKVRDIMTKNPAVCTVDTPLREVAQMMVNHHCGAIPVVESRETNTLVGIITDRDIVCRILARGQDPVHAAASDCMSSPVVTVRPEADVEEACELMERNQIRRIAVVDADEGCQGVLTQAQVARALPEEKIGGLIRRVSEKTEEPSRVMAGR
jgi:CBS domain-containing protein